MDTLYDYLKRYESEEAAFADPLTAPFHSEGVWNEGVTVPGVRIYILDGMDVTEEGTPMELRTWFPYWYLWVCLPELDLDLAAASVVVGNRETGEVVDSMLPVEDWPLYHPDRVPMGSHYPFGVVSDNNESL